VFINLFSNARKNEIDGLDEMHIIRTEITKIFLTWLNFLIGYYFSYQGNDYFEDWQLVIYNFPFCLPILMLFERIVNYL